MSRAGLHHRIPSSALPEATQLDHAVGDGTYAQWFVS
jgi:hypothetical protein